MAVAKFRSFSKAAQHLMISQPAISHQISKLEQELDLLVFDRTGREVKLTEAGVILQDFFYRAQTEYAEALESARARQNAFFGKVLLGYPDGWEISSFYSMFNEFQENYPNVHIELVCVPMGEMEEALLSGRIDVAITMHYTIQHSQLISSRTLCAVRNVLLYSQKFPIAPGHSATLADFRDSIFYLATADNIHPFREAVLLECAKYGFVPQMSNCSNLSTALFYVQNNQGVFLGNELLMANRDDRLYAHLILNDVQQPVLLAWRTDATASAVSLFVNETLYSDKFMPLRSRLDSKASGIKAV